MHHNILGYWRHLQNLPDDHVDKPCPRVCRLMLGMFEKWQTQQAFPDWNYFGHIRDQVDEDDPPDLMNQHIAVRRGVALRKTLQQLVSTEGQQHGLSAIHPDELIVGTMPPYSVGQGKEPMGYFKDERDDYDEVLAFEIGYLNGWSNFGHIVPDHGRIVQRGLRSLMDECRTRLESNSDDNEQAFYQSVLQVLEGVIRYAAGFAKLANDQVTMHEELLRCQPDHPTRGLFEERIEGMRKVAERLQRIPAEPCESFTDAIQCIFIMNCALHWTGELTSLGRLDQILFPYYKKDNLTYQQAQELIECLWIKLDERVMLNNRHFEDRFSSADGALLGAGGASNFDQGALANQWMQQVTLGGVIANQSARQEPADNDITRMCLEAARRLPFNCPTVDLRVHSKTPTDLLELAASAMLSGGAHPILMNDDKLIPALHKKSGGTVDLASARNYACDGCYETIFPGETEFSFFYIPGVDVLEKTLNSGAGFGAAGGTYLRGVKDSFRTLPAHQIEDYPKFYSILEKHIWLSVNRQLSSLLRVYGCKGNVCPSPLLSAMIEGCLESGRDFYNGGAKYHMFAPLMTGISTVADSLYVIENLVFKQKRFTLPELVACLRSNWGETGRDVIGLKLSPERIQDIREQCLSQPKFGSGNRQVDKYAWKLINSFVKIIDKARSNPLHAQAFKDLKSRFDLSGRPFELLLTPGVGTFEQYLFGGGFAGATPDGRAAGDSLASDLSASPVPRDQEPILLEHTTDENGEYARQYVLLDSLSSWDNSAVNKLSDGAPSDFNIREDFPLNELVKVLKEFAQGKGSNIMTVTVANPETLHAAELDPDQFNLLRVRMGGWTEYYAVLFSGHKAHHRRRPVYVAKSDRKNN